MEPYKTPAARKSKKLAKNKDKGILKIITNIDK